MVHKVFAVYLAIQQLALVYLVPKDVRTVLGLSTSTKESSSSCGSNWQLWCPWLPRCCWHEGWQGRPRLNSISHHRDESSNRICLPLGLDGVCGARDGLKGGKGEPGYPGESGMFIQLQQGFTDAYWLLLGTPGQRGGPGDKGDRGMFAVLSIKTD